MTQEQRAELVRLQVASLRQGGHLMRELRQMRKDAADHSETDTKLFRQSAERCANLEAGQVELKTEVRWLKKVGMWLVPASIAAHFIK